MKVDLQIALECAHPEGIVRQAYRDSTKKNNGKGVWTWSVGLTSATGHNVERYIGQPQSLEKCLSVYIWALRRYAAEVEQAFAPITLTKEQFTAALSFHWNTGAIKRASWVRHFKNGNVTRAKEGIMNYRKPKEIIPRRKAERDLFFDGVWSNNGTMTEYTMLDAKSRPIWKSAKKIYVREPLAKVFAGKPSKPINKPLAGAIVGGTALAFGFWDKIWNWIEGLF